MGYLGRRILWGAVGLWTGMSAWAVPLPIEAEVALDAAKVPREAMVAWVQEVGASAPRLDWQARQPVNPASLMKLLTTSAALELLGPAWSWSTPVWLQGTVRRPGPNGVLDGDLVIRGTGDPKLVPERLWMMLRRVQQLGVHEIRGDIVLDRSAFRPGLQNPGDFDGDPLRPYNVQPDALMLNYKSLTLTFAPDALAGVARITADVPLSGLQFDDSVPLISGPCDDWRAPLMLDVADPARLKVAGGFRKLCGEKAWSIAWPEPQRYSERLLRGLWSEMGGKLTGRVRDGTAPSAPPSFELLSPPLAEVIRDINKYSNNVMAQQLFLTLGLTQRGLGSPELAREVLRQWVAERYPDAAPSVVVDNGSGLSRDSRVTAQLLGRVLQADWAGPAMPELMSSLPVSGLDGTMKRSRAPSGRAHLKTGSLKDVAGIAGYVLGNSGRRYVLVAIVNHPNANAARPALEAITQWVINDTLSP
jgi:serine-type D-Ala-D-Ala carboxypeptidase/endopeptidase (penicillin-binding protein 4)